MDPGPGPEIEICAGKIQMNLPNAVYARDAKLIPMAWGPWSLNKAIKTESLGVDVVVVISVGVVVLAVVVFIDTEFEVNGVVVI